MFKRKLFGMVGKMYLGHRLETTNPANCKTDTIVMLQKYLEMLETLPEPKLIARPLVGNWSGIEVAYHAINSTKTILKICDGLATGKKVPDMMPSEIGRTKSLYRKDVLSFARPVLKEVMDFTFTFEESPTCNHPVFGPRDLKQWLVLNLVHLERHYRQFIKAMGIPN